MHGLRTVLWTIPYPVNSIYSTKIAIAAPKPASRGADVIMGPAPPVPVPVVTPLVAGGLVFVGVVPVVAPPVADGPVFVGVAPVEALSFSSPAVITSLIEVVVNEFCPTVTVWARYSIGIVVSVKQNGG